MGDSIEIELEVREVSPLDEGALPRPVKARTLALKGWAPEQYAYREDPRRYSEEVRKALESGKPPVVEVTLEDELKALAMWSDYDSPWRSYWEGRPTQQEILRAYQDINLGRKPHNQW